MKRASNLHWLLLLTFGALFFLSAYMGYGISTQARTEQEMFDELEEIVHSAAEPLPDTARLVQSPKIGDFFSAYAALEERNPDFFGWISIEGTKLDYPVMHTPEDGEYEVLAAFYSEAYLKDAEGVFRYYHIPI